MNIKRSVDIEEEVRNALSGYLTAYVRPLPQSYSLPNILIKMAGGTTTNTIDAFTVSLEARAEEDAEAYEYLRTAIGILEEQTAKQIGALRCVNVNSMRSLSIN